MSEAPETGVETPAPTPAENPAAEAPQGTAATETPAEGSAASGEAPEGQQPASEEPKKPKSPVAQLQGRVGHLTKTLHEKDTALTQAQKELETYRALLSAQGKSPEGEGAPPPAAAHSSTMAQGSAEWQAAVRQEARQLAARDAFDRDCNVIYDSGVKAHGETFKEAVANLGALDLMSPTLVQAALATGAAPEVINALGSDVDEAARIAGLPPAQMGVELARLAIKLQAPKDGPQISRAPAPITPIGGQSQATTDVYDPNLSMAEYVRRRQAQGSRWAK